MIMFRSRTPRSRYYASAGEEDECGYFCGSTGTRRDAKAKEATEDDEATLREMLVRYVILLIFSEIQILFKIINLYFNIMFMF